jgi:hypothetical protein
MRTTLDIPDDLFREVKTLAVQKGVKLKDLLAQFIESGLHSPLPVFTAPPKETASPIPIAIPRKRGTRKTPALSKAQLNAILENQEIAKFQQLHAH